MENIENVENKEENKDEKKITEPKKSKSLMIILVSLIILLLVFGGFGWWYVSKKAAQEKRTLDDTRSTLEKQLNDLKNQKTPTPSTALTLSPTPLTSSGCTSTLTDADNLAISTWGTYTNNKYNYSFKYPDNWVISEDQEDFVSLSDDEVSINLQFRSDAMSAIGYESYKVDSELDVEVACVNTVKTSLSGNIDLDPESANDRMIFTLFNKDSVPHLVMMTYQYIGASISSDIVEAFDLILKTIEFE